MSELDELRKEIAELRRQVAAPGVPKPPRQEVSGKTAKGAAAPTALRVPTPERAWDRSEYVRRGGGGPYQASPWKAPGRAFPMRQGGPGGVYQQFLEESVYPTTDEWGERTPFWQPDWIRNVTGGEPMRYLDLWNHYMRGPRRFLK